MAHSGAKKLGPEQLSLVVPKNLDGLTGGVGETPAEPVSKGGLQIKASAPNGLAFSPDGKLLATLGGDGSAKLWNAETGELVANLPHPWTPTCLAFSADGKRLATGSEKERGRQQPNAKAAAVFVWDVADGKVKQTLSSEEPCVAALAFSPDGKTLAAAKGRFGLPMPTTLWNLAEEKEVALPKPSDYRFRATCLAFSPDGKTLAAGSKERHEEVLLFDVAARTERESFKGHTDGVDALAFSPDGKLLLVGPCGAGNTVKLWELSTGENKAARIAFRARHHFVAFSTKGRPLVIDTVEQNASVWDVATGKELLSLRDSDAISTAAFSPDGKSLATGGYGNSVQLWKLRD